MLQCRIEATEIKRGRDREGEGNREKREDSGRQIGYKSKKLITTGHNLRFKFLISFQTHTRGCFKTSLGA